MARTAIPVYSLGPYQANVQTSPIAGDAANDHSLDLTYAPRLVLITRNKSGSLATNFTIELPAAKNSYNDTISKTYALSAGQTRIFVLDFPPDLAQTGNLLHLDSADANFSNLRLFAYTWTNTPWR